MPLGARLWHYAAELCTLSVTSPLCGSALTDTTDYPLKLTYFYLFLYHWSYTILQGPLIPAMTFTSCHDRGSNRLPPDGRASAATPTCLAIELKVKYLRGAFWQSRSLKWPDFPCPSEPGFGIMPLSSALSQLHILCGSALTDTTDNPSEMCPLKLTDFCLFLYHWSYTILQEPFIPPMAFTSCHDRGLNRLPPDGRASTLTTQPLRLATL